jgi:hypothetical protein
MTENIIEYLVTEFSQLLRLLSGQVALILPV